MPELDTSLHLDMLHEYKRQNGLLSRFHRAIRELVSPGRQYGLHWGDPEISGPQVYVRDKYLLPYVKPDHVGLEIGPGGGRWTRYLLGFKTLYVVDFHAELLNELRRHCNTNNMRFIVNHGTDFPGVPPNSIDFIASIACFVHLEPHVIESYLGSMKSILKSGGNVVLTYSDKTKAGGQLNSTFSENSPERMRQMVRNAGFHVVEEDLTVLWNSGIIRFTR